MRVDIGAGHGRLITVKYGGMKRFLHSMLVSAALLASSSITVSPAHAAADQRDPRDLLELKLQLRRQAYENAVEAQKKACAETTGDPLSLDACTQATESVEKYKLAVERDRSALCSSVGAGSSSALSQLKRAYLKGASGCTGAGELWPYLLLGVLLACIYPATKAWKKIRARETSPTQ